jgi:hypothetical protein
MYNKKKDLRKAILTKKELKQAHSEKQKGLFTCPLANLITLQDVE